MSQTLKFTIEGNIPSKKNGKLIICRPYPRMISKPEYLAWHEELMWKLKKYRPEKPIERCEIIIKYWGENKRRTDLDNKNSSIFDLLVDCEILLDDNWFVIYKQSSELVDINKEKCRAEITIKSK
jgi:Holliday junction resolvase RusA-like endonuclease